ncbi:transglutaminase domain-containing protein [Motiliproteus sediminis]|uniref:transglutaminase domain-containing protein n=1 Tax=Motiliproteus sediminis TaxID=1468178 RepID=UPI001AEFB120|nr:transglutaminase family protein [Motiliproteus sediminis]
MWLRTRCDLTFELEIETPFILMLRPRSGANQWVSREEYQVEPQVPVFEFTDRYGNLCQRLVAPPGPFAVRTVADLKVADEIDRALRAPFVKVQHLPDGVLCYLLPSRYCESDHFNEMATEISAGERLGYDQVAAIETWLRTTYRYAPGSTSSTLSAVEVNARQVAICRDLAHLGIALCRALSIPARMVVGYLHRLEPMDLHAWFEAYVGNRWYTFDATQTELHGGYVALGYGRDAADVAVFNQFGAIPIATLQRVQVELLRD